MSDFAADTEILELAIAREVDANRFYLSLAGRITNPEMRKVFEDLAVEELEHKAKLELEVMKEGRVLSADHETVGLLEKGAEELGQGRIDMSYKEMLVVAMKKEETSFRLYVDLAGRVTDPNSKETLLALAEEEAKHKLRFEVEYDNALKNS